MQIATDQTLTARGARLGKILTLGSLGLLLAGLLLAWRVPNLPLYWLAGVMVVGMVAATLGLGYMNRWVREPRPEKVLEQALKGFDDQYQLYNYVLPAPHVLLGPAGLYVLTALGQDGDIRYDGKFHRKPSVGRMLRFLADEGLGKPFAEGDAQVAALRAFLEKCGAADGVEIQNVLVFFNPRAQLTVTDPPRPVVAPKELKRTLRKKAEVKLAPDRYQRLADLFAKRLG
jgi:hypothetical protein